MKRKQPKVQFVFKMAGRSYTRHEQAGKVRSLHCKHGVQCVKCFVPTIAVALPLDEVTR